MLVYQQSLQDLQTLRDFLRFGVSLCNEHQVACGHGYADSWDETVAIVLSTLHLPQDCDPRVLDARLTQSEKERVLDRLERRAIDKIPTGYLIGEAWFAGLSFVVNENVIIPRSPMAELIENQFMPWIAADKIDNVLDLCTGSGCIAIACAHYMSEVHVDAVELSEAALEIATQNVCDYCLDARVNLIQSDLWQAVPDTTYDVIISNPPYVARDEYASLPQEYHLEPEMALAADDRGLAIVDRILASATNYLSDHGILLVEVGSAQNALIERYPKLPFCWLDFVRGGEGVFLLTREQLEAHFGR